MVVLEYVCFFVDGDVDCFEGDVVGVEDGFEVGSGGDDVGGVGCEGCVDVEGGIG